MTVNMLCWKVIIIIIIISSSLFYCSSTNSVYHRSGGLYPSALRVRRGTASLVNPVFQNSINDVNLLFEILLAGLQFEEEGRLLSIHDEELTSLRQTRKLVVICEDVLPKTLTEVRRVTFALARSVGSLRREDFERTVLTLVYTAQRVSQAGTDHQREAWAESFISLYKAIKEDLTNR